MNRYETVGIIRPDVGDDVVKGIIAKVGAVCEAEGGKVNRVDEWGRRRLAYPIGKKNEGYYFVVDYVSTTDASKEIGRQLRLNEDVLRHQTVRVIEGARGATAEKPKEQAQQAPEGGTTNGK